ncbi:hypothetical protein CD139_08265 [Staphylococcus piscifermentans]|nr:hypothetical protein CD139_08265 [Staphylococcus piscifermentans]
MRSVTSESISYSTFVVSPLRVLSVLRITLHIARIDKLLRHFKFDKAFLSCGAFDTSQIYEYDLEEALVSNMMIKQSAKTILLADSTKQDSKDSFVINKFKEIDYIITDYTKPEEVIFLITPLALLLWVLLPILQYLYLSYLQSYTCKRVHLLVLLRYVRDCFRSLLHYKKF